MITLPPDTPASRAASARTTRLECIRATSEFRSKSSLGSAPAPCSRTCVSLRPWTRAREDSLR
eukprot:scaffold136988_cov66-Phaeocystis_antarctica.AAC.1